MKCSFSLCMSTRSLVHRICLELPESPPQSLTYILRPTVGCSALDSLYVTTSRKPQVQTQSHPSPLGLLVCDGHSVYKTNQTFVDIRHSDKLDGTSGKQISSTYTTALILSNNASIRCFTPRRTQTYNVTNDYPNAQGSRRPRRRAQARTRMI